MNTPWTPASVWVRRAVRGLALCLGVQGSGPALAAPSAVDYKNGVTPCMRARDYECAEKNWVQYIRLRPSDSGAIANLGVVLHMQGKHEQAVAQFQKAIAMGEGTYDMFGLLAKSLEALGRKDEAIDWSYKALAVVPDLVDVRGSLAKLLVSKGRHYEALSLLASYDAKLEGTGRRPYFEGQRIAIESTAAGAAASTGAARQSFRVSKFGDHFYVPVSMGSARPRGFVIDTGASATTVSEDFLASTKAQHVVLDPSVSVTLADGRRHAARAITVARLKVGPFELRNVPVLACKGCALLMGQSTLSRFDLNSSKFQGVEFMTLSPRFPVSTNTAGTADTTTSDAVPRGRASPGDGPDKMTLSDDFGQAKGAARVGAAQEHMSALPLARECLDLDDALSDTKRRLEESGKTGTEETARIHQEGRELAEIRHGLGSAEQSAIDTYNGRIEAHNRAIAAANQRMEQLSSEQDRFNDAVQSRNEKCSNVALNDRDYRTFLKERDARRKAAAVPTPSATPSDPAKP